MSLQLHFLPCCSQGCIFLSNKQFFPISFCIDLPQRESFKVLIWKPLASNEDRNSGFLPRKSNCTKQLPREHPLQLFSCRKHPWRFDSRLQPFSNIQEPKSHYQELLQHRQGLFNLMLSQGAVTTQRLCYQRSGLHLLALEPLPALSQQETSLSSINSLNCLKRKLPKHEMNPGSVNTQLLPNWLFKCTCVNAGTQQCISLQGWKVCSPPEAAGLTFHKLQSCFPFLLIFSFQRSFTTHTHPLTKQGKVKEAVWFPGTAVSHSINEANLQSYYKDISICIWLGKKSFLLWISLCPTPRPWEQGEDTSLHTPWAAEGARSSSGHGATWGRHPWPWQGLDRDELLGSLPTQTILGSPLKLSASVEHPHLTLRQPSFSHQELLQPALLSRVSWVISPLSWEAKRVRLQSSYILVLIFLDQHRKRDSPKVMGVLSLPQPELESLTRDVWSQKIWAVFGCREHGLCTQIWEPSMVNTLSEISKEHNIFSDYYHISLRRLVCSILEGVRSLISIKYQI